MVPLHLDSHWAELNQVRSANVKLASATDLVHLVLGIV